MSNTANTANSAKIPFFKAEKIADKSWQISQAFIKPSPAFYCYLVEGQDYALLIDSLLGFGILKDFCKTLIKKPIKLVNTHAHWDHISGNIHFDSCYIHHREIPLLQEAVGYKKEQFFAIAKQMALPEYAELLTPDKNFADAKPMKVFPLYDGDVFDLGDRQIEVLKVAGHTPGSIVLIDPKTRLAYAGDACNSNTLLEFPHSLPVASYMKGLLKLQKRKGDFDKLYCGHEVQDFSIIDEGIETVARVIAGTDDRYEAIGMLGKPVLYAAKKVKDGYERADGKKFNMSYDPARAFLEEPKNQIIK